MTEKDPVLTEQYLKIAHREYAACQHCSLPECSPDHKSCLLRGVKRKRSPQARVILEKMYLRGATLEEITAATGYTVSTAKYYIKQLKGKVSCDPCPTCVSRSICEAYHGTCHDKEMWKGKRVSEGLQSP